MFLFCLALFLLPLFMDHEFYLGILTLTAIFAVFAASWDLLSGFTGQISFGHAIFFGVAVYTAALLNVKVGLPPAVTVPVGALMAVVAGLVVGLPSLRLRGTYLAFTTLAFPLILMEVVKIVPGWGGELGLSGVGSVDPLSASPVVEYYVALTVMVILGFVMWKITDSKTGLIFHAIREDEVTARASGINTTRYSRLRAHGLIPSHHLGGLRRDRDHLRPDGRRVHPLPADEVPAVGHARAENARCGRDSPSRHAVHARGADHVAAGQGGEGMPQMQGAQRGLALDLPRVHCGPGLAVNGPTGPGMSS
jgi:hypothetical protein